MEEYQKFAALRIEAVNHALKGIPDDRVRYHICWRSWHGPHTTDISLRDIVHLLLSVHSGAYSVEAANARHEHEWRVWQDIKLPAGKYLYRGLLAMRPMWSSTPSWWRNGSSDSPRCGARERHSRHRLRPRWSRARGGCLGQARSAGRGSGAGHKGTLALAQFRRSRTSASKQYGCHSHRTVKRP